MGKAYVFFTFFFTAFLTETEYDRYAERGSIPAMPKRSGTKIGILLNQNLTSPPIIFIKEMDGFGRIIKKEGGSPRMPRCSLTELFEKCKRTVRGNRAAAW